MCRIDRKIRGTGRPRALALMGKRNRHVRVTEQYQMLCAKLRGHYQYYGIRGNYKMLEVVFEHAERTWKRWLGRRTRDGKIAWEEFEDRYRKVFPLPKPHIVHAF